jgi:hypothetical protein
MVDRQLRDEFATYIEAFLLAKVDGPALGRGFRKAGEASAAAGHLDAAIPALTQRLWQEYPDYYWRGGGYGPGSDRVPSDLGAKALPAGPWNVFVRAALFLRSDRELEWPEDQWDAYEDLSSPPDVLALLVLGCASIAGMAAIGLLFCRQWAGGGAAALITLGLGYLYAHLNRQGRQQVASGPGDRSAFPFFSEDQLADELLRQGGPCVPFRRDLRG